MQLAWLKESPGSGLPPSSSFSFGLLPHSCVCSAPSPSNCYFFKQTSATKSREKATLQLFHLISWCQKLPQGRLSELASSFLGRSPRDRSRGRPGPAEVQDRVRAAASSSGGNRIFSPLCPEAVIWLSQQQAVLSNYLLVVPGGYIL